MDLIQTDRQTDRHTIWSHRHTNTDRNILYFYLNYQSSSIDPLMCAVGGHWWLIRKDKLLNGSRIWKLRRLVQQMAVVHIDESLFTILICLISISDTVCDGGTETLIPNIERAKHDYLAQGFFSPICCIVFVERGFKNSQFYKERTNSSTLSPPKNFATRDAFSAQNRMLLRKNANSAWRQQRFSHKIFISVVYLHRNFVQFSTHLNNWSKN